MDPLRSLTAEAAGQCRLRSNPGAMVLHELQWPFLSMAIAISTKLAIAGAIIATRAHHKSRGTVRTNTKLTIQSKSQSHFFGNDPIS